MTDSEFVPFECVTIVGVGLMGGSLGLAIRERGLARRVVGVERDATVLGRAIERGAIDFGTAELAESVRHADCVVLATPVGTIPTLLEALVPHCRPDALITDLGSTKTRIVEAGTRLFGNRFVGGHPMAGSEEGGIEASSADLFSGAAWAIVRPAPFTPINDHYTLRLMALVTALQTRPVLLDAALHDRLVALVSHLPHILSFSFAHTLHALPDSEQARALAAGSFRDMMRVSVADPVLWSDILHDNRAALLEIVTSFESQLQTLKKALEAEEKEPLLTALRGEN